MGKKKSANFKPFHRYETADWVKGGIEDHYTRMTHSQLMAMTSLNTSAAFLYIMMKDYACGRFETEYPHSIYSKFLSRRGFQNSIQELVNHGFIEPFVSNKNLRQPNTYRFSSKWVDNWLNSLDK